ncbi:hypothetical protein N7492_006123 [Penicillium capsulatum]|uniref:Uncharacterized protein n=1 Tax=Penicillium capsulatum TaxID=69766 RepID=A0A9W9I6B2_9EURO|nr:hypothetical protein N7492_006123 [Penicillium capsulatum]KAJ6108773.1 hypothetical protein N7512_008610 [Penicillium capsulatum]
MGKRGVEAVDWYLEHWNQKTLQDDDRLRRDIIAGALKSIFAWEIDPSLGTGTKYYKHVAEDLPAQLGRAGHIRGNDIHIECSLSFLHDTHKGQTSQNSNGQKQFWSDLHNAWDLAPPNACDGGLKTSLLKFQTAPKEVVAICADERQKKKMKTDLRHLLEWDTYLTRGVDYTLDLYSGSLSSVLFQELARTSKAGEAKLREYSTSSGDKKLASNWAGVTQLAVQSAGLTFSNAPSVMFFGLVMYLQSLGFIFDFDKGTMQVPESDGWEEDCTVM